MRLSYIATYLAIAVSAAHAASLPNNALERLEDHAVSPRSEDILSPKNTLEKRKGGGGRGGGGGSSSGGGGGRSSSGGAAGRTSPSSNAGGSTRSGTGPSRSFGGGGYYGGGSSTPYKSGSNTPGGLAPGLLLGGVAVLAIMPGLWLYNVYPYHFNNPYRFYNQSAQNETNPNGINQTLPVTCLCQEYSVCGCDENDDEQYLKDLVGNGSYAALNKTLVTVSDVNGTQTLVLNGSLPNGTTAPGGSDDDVSTAISLTVGKYGGYWVTGLIVLYTCAFM